MICQSKYLRKLVIFFIVTVVLLIHGVSYPEAVYDLVFNTRALKLADVGLIADMFPLTMAWEKLKVIQRERRKEIGPTLFEWFEHLYNEIKKREQKPKQSEA